MLSRGLNLLSSSLNVLSHGLTTLSCVLTELSPGLSTLFCCRHTLTLGHKSWPFILWPKYVFLCDLNALWPRCIISWLQHVISWSQLIISWPFWCPHCIILWLQYIISWPQCVICDLNVQRVPKVWIRRQRESSLHVATSGANPDALRSVRRSLVEHIYAIVAKSKATNITRFMVISVFNK